MIAAINDLGADRKQLDKETWRFNQFTRSEASIWGRLISKIKLNQTESIRHSLYSFWQRNREKIESDTSETRLDSVGEDDELDKDKGTELSSPHSENKSLPSDASLPHLETRSTVQHQVNLRVVTEASFIMSHEEWKYIYDRSTCKMNSEWTHNLSESMLI